MDSITEASTKYGCDIIAFVSDNESKMVAVRKLIDEYYSKEGKLFFTYGCASHYLNLLGGDICKKKTIAALLIQVKEINKYFRNHYKAKNYMGKIDGSCTPQLPGDTRWNSILTCLETYVRNSKC